jgi:hypothetical protein
MRKSARIIEIATILKMVKFAGILLGGMQKTALRTFGA